MSATDVDSAPPHVLALATAGNVDGVREALTPLPEGMSKAQQKKLIKSAEIAAKKLAKGGGSSGGGGEAAVAAPAASFGAVTKGVAEMKSGATSLPPVASAAAAAAGGLIVGEAERVLVSELLASMRGLSLPDGALDCLHEHEAALCQAIAPLVNTLRNQAYTQGFSSRKAAAT